MTDKKKQLAVDIVTGQVASYAKTAANIQGLSHKELADILRYIAGQLE